MQLVDELNALDSARASYEADFRRVAKEHLRDYVESVTNSAPSFGKNAFICPCCKSGTGNNGHYTPAFFLFRNKQGEMSFKCHACNISGNVFALAGLVNGVSSFRKQRELVADFLHINLAKQTPLHNLRIIDGTKYQQNQQGVAQLKSEVRSYIADCANHVDETDYFERRGLTLSTIERFRLGYDPIRRVAVIPFNSQYYIGRFVDVAADAKAAKKHYKPAGLRQPIFNLSALSSDSRKPVFVTEAPLDAISIIQAGGSAIALGGTSSALLEKILDVCRPRTHFVLAFDQDKAGQFACEKLGSFLAERNMSFTVAVHPVFTRFKDANAALMADPNGLIEGIGFEQERAINSMNMRTKEVVFQTLDDDIYSLVQSAHTLAAMKNEALLHNGAVTSHLVEMDGR